MKTKLTDGQRLALIRDVFQKCFSETDTFATELGLQLAYLFGAISKANGAECIELSEEQDEDVLRDLREWFPSEHRVWEFIEVV